MKKLALILCVLIPSLSMATSISVIHPNHSPSEVKAYKMLQNSLEKVGLTWSSELAETAEFPDSEQIKGLVFQDSETARVAQINGKELERWYDLGVVRHLTRVADQNRWREFLPDFVYKQIQHRSQIVAVPSGLHVTNTIWASKSIIDQTGLPLDNSWVNFLSLLAAIQANGISPIAVIDIPQSDALIFESLLLAEVGAEPYNAVMKDLDSSSLRAIEPAFERVFKKMDQLKPYILRLPADSQSSRLVEAIVAGEAAMTFQGTWLQGAFNLKGLIANQQYYCAQVPGPNEGVVFKLETFAALATNQTGAQQHQEAFAMQVLDKDTQFLLNNYSGALPVTPNTGLEALNECNAELTERITNATATGNIVGSTAYGMNLPIPIGEEVLSIIHDYMKSGSSAAETANHLRKRMKYGSFVIN